MATPSFEKDSYSACGCCGMATNGRLPETSSRVAEQPYKDLANNCGALCKEKSKKKLRALFCSSRS